MKKLLMTTTALIALGGVTSALADLSISGNARWTYTTWSDKVVETDTKSANNKTAMGEGLEIWFNADETADSGLTYGAAARLRQGTAGLDRNWVYLSDDWGKLTFGRQWSPLIAGSLGANWRGTIKGAQQSKLASGGLRKDSWITTSGNNPKVIYNSPNISGLTVGVSFTDGGSSDGKKAGIKSGAVVPVDDGANRGKADSTSWRVNYSTDIMDGSGLTIGYGTESRKAVDGKDASADLTLTEMGVEFTSGDFLVSAIQMKDKSDKNKATPKTVKDQTINEVELAYNATDVLTLNFIALNSKEDAKGTKKGDKYSSNAFGLKYEIAPGLLANVLYTKADLKPAKGSPTKKGSGNTTYFELRMNF
jgi:predicted porin